jgi:ferredoxin--NADP+ reductase
MTANMLNAVVTARIEVAPGLIILRVAPDGWDLPPFKPGQFAVLGLPPEAGRHPVADPEGDPPPKPCALIRRSYSIASSSLESEYLEFYLTLVRSGSLTPRLFALAVGDRLWLGPKITGLFTFEHVPHANNLVMVATGTGLAPYMSQLRTTLLHGPEKRVAVLHGARHSWDLGYRAELVTMQRGPSHLLYVPVVSRPDEEPVAWAGEVGYVQDLWTCGILERSWGVRPDPSNTHVFLCGNPGMIEAMAELLAAEGFREHSRQRPGEIHVEKYW